MFALLLTLLIVLVAVAVYALLQRGEIRRLREAGQTAIGERDDALAEVERLRHLDSKLAAARATITAKEETIERLCDEHDDELDGFRDQRVKLAEMSTRLDCLSREAKEAATKGRAAAEGSKRTESLFLGWTKSISNPQGRGALGELSIERQLIDLGLVKGRDFVSQEPGNDRKRRDIVVRAGEVRVVIDSKWTADPEVGDLREAVNRGDRDDVVWWGKRLRDRAKSLAARHYERGRVAGPRLVLMYVPVEGAYEALASVDGFSLEKFSRDTGVYVVTPSQLGLALGLVAELWRDAGREEQLLEISRELAGMGERTAELVEDLDALGRSISTVVNHFNRIVGRLTNRGGMFQQAKVLWRHVGRRFKKDVLRGADGEVLRLEQPRDDAAVHADAWRDIEAEAEAETG